MIKKISDILITIFIKHLNHNLYTKMDEKLDKIIESLSPNEKKIIPFLKEKIIENLSEKTTD